jgi:phage shock protein A
MGIIAWFKGLFRKEPTDEERVEKYIADLEDQYSEIGTSSGLLLEQRRLLQIDVESALKCVAKWQGVLDSAAKNGREDFVREAAKNKLEAVTQHQSKVKMLEDATAQLDRSQKLMTELGDKIGQVKSESVTLQNKIKIANASQAIDTASSEPLEKLREKALSAECTAQAYSETNFSKPQVSELDIDAEVRKAMGKG